MKGLRVEHLGFSAHILDHLLTSTSPLLYPYTPDSAWETEPRYRIEDTDFVPHCGLEPTYYIPRGSVYPLDLEQIDRATPKAQPLTSRSVPISSVAPNMTSLPFQLDNFPIRDGSLHALTWILVTQLAPTPRLY